MSVNRGRMAPQDVLASYFQAIEREVASASGVRVASLTSNVPLDGQRETQPFTVVGDAPVDLTLRTQAHYQIITPRYFAALGISLLQGCAFTDRDTSTTVPVCIVDEEIARRQFNGRNPIGARISVPSVTVLVPV